METAPGKGLLAREPRKVILFKKHKNEVSKEDADIISSLHIVSKALGFAQMNFELANDDLLVDSFIYEIMALNKRYDFYIKLCKERGLIAEGFAEKGVE